MAPPRQRGGWGSPDWEEFSTGGPIPVEGGLTARSTRGGIGEQWWSRRFIAVLESFALGGRLTRGRNYARKGQVISLQVEPGEVTAAVQGSRPAPYQVRIGLAKFSGLIWAKAEVVLAEQAIHSARLLAGEFPPELEPVFEGIGAPLFPTRLGDLTLSCSCPDHVIPCKHLAAVFYLLAERFDDDPFLILLWRGRGREALLARLRDLRADDDEGTAQFSWGGSNRLEPAEAGAGPGRHGGRGAGQAGGSGQGGGSDQGGSQGAIPLVSPVGARAALISRHDQASTTSAAHTTSAAPDGAGADGAPGTVADFWTAAPLPPLPVQVDLPVDLLLRLLPVPGPGLGGSRLLGLLEPLYELLDKPAPETHSDLGHGNLGP